MPNGEVNNLIKEPGIQILFSLLKKGGKKEKKKKRALVWLVTTQNRELESFQNCSVSVVLLAWDC